MKAKTKYPTKEDYPVIKDGYVQISIAEYDELLALSKIKESEGDFEAKNFTACKNTRDISDHLESLMK